MSAAIPYLRVLVEIYDVVFICEHWLHHNRLTKLDEVSNDHEWFARSSRFSGSDSYGSARGQGGIAIVWKKCIGGVTPLTNIHHDRICGIKLQTKTGAIFNLLCVYLPPKGSIEDFSTVLDELGACIDGMDLGSQTIICGDLNADIGRLADQRSSKIPNREGKLLFKFLADYGLTAANRSDRATGPQMTFHNEMGQSSIDYILIPDVLWESVLDCGCLDEHVLNTSDHSPVFTTLSIKDISRQSIEVKRPSRLKWDKLDDQSMNVRFTQPVSVGLDNLYIKYALQPASPALVDEMINEIVETLREGEKRVPKSKFSKHLKPFWSDELTLLKFEKVKAYKEWIKAGRSRIRDDPLYVKYKSTKKDFIKRLRQVSKGYDEVKVNEIIKSAECDHTNFWRILKRETSGPKTRIPSIKNKQEKTVYDIDGILNVWKVYFSELCTPKVCNEYDKLHYESVSKQVRELINRNDIDQFTENPFSCEEIRKGITKLNSGKTPGFDSITKEHLKHSGDSMVTLLHLMFKWIIELEYIPVNFRTGIQIPLHKGKNLSTLETKNYRGITLLTTFNKLFEALMWGRIQTWWEESNVISRLQGACRSGVSCIHTALILQESVATQLETHKKVFVAYFDVARAFDSVWIDGLFSRIYALGIRGRTWRLLYKTYIGFKCSVRIHNKMSVQYEMKCGIHQGGYLSLLKYIAFINSLLVSLEESDLCSTIYGLKLSPLGYADDIASASTSKQKVDQVLNMVYSHSRKWRYDFNAKKSAILVYGETAHESKVNSSYRNFRLGPDKVSERECYDHVGLKCCLHKNYAERTQEKIQKGRKALNSASGIGIKAGGVSMRACSLLFWSLIVPIVTFASELWVLKDQDIDALEGFQRYAGRKVQRFSTCTPNETSFTALGWMRFENFIYVKKMLFIRTILVLDESNPCRQIFVRRAHDFLNNMQNALRNEHDSPVFDLLRVAQIYGMLGEVMRMAVGTHWYEKSIWKKLVWQNAWSIEDQDWRYRISYFRSTSLLSCVMGNVKYLVWWRLSDMIPSLMRQCEDMAKLLCRTSKLKADVPRLKAASPVERMCSLCNLYQIEDAKHVILYCDYVNDLRAEMHEKINGIPGNAGIEIMQNSSDLFYTLLGKKSNVTCEDDHVTFCAVIAQYISKMYRRITSEREGVG